MTVIDKSSALPYYRQLAELLRQDIDGSLAEEGVYQLPSENELADRYGLSRATVRHALDELEKEGRIYKQKGVGAFAPARRIELDLTALVSTTEDMRQRGWRLVTRVLALRRIAAPAAVAAALRLVENDPVFEVVRLRIVDEEPLSLQTTYLPAALCPTLPNDNLTGSLYRLLESRYGLRLWNARETLRARGASDMEALQLGIAPDAPVLAAERITYAADGAAVEYLEAVWRGDRYEFNLTLTRPAM